MRIKQKNVLIVQFIFSAPIAPPVRLVAILMRDEFRGDVFSDREGAKSGEEGRILSLGGGSSSSSSNNNNKKPTCLASLLPIANEGEGKVSMIVMISGRRSTMVMIIDADRFRRFGRCRFL